MRSCVEQHIECIQQVESELHDSSATEPAIISNAAESIIAANGLVQHQFNDIQRMIDNRHGEIQDHLTDPYGLFFTFASLDRQRHVYRQVLSSLEMLAAELMGNIQNHGQRLKKITNGLEESEPKKVEDITDAVAQIFDATDEMQQKIESTEQHLGEQAEKVHMQAVLSHTDLLTSLPNRRAFEAEVEQLAARTHGKSTYFTIMFLDLDNFNQINSQYGHQGGDVILRQAAGVVKQLMRGSDMVARYRGRHVCVHPAADDDARRAAGGRAVAGGDRADRIRPRQLSAAAHCERRHRPVASRGELPNELTARAEQALKAADRSRRQFVLLARRQDLLPGVVGLQADRARHRTDRRSWSTMFRRKLTGEDGAGRIDRDAEPNRTTARCSRAGRCSWPICSGGWRNGSGAGRSFRCSC